MFSSFLIRQTPLNRWLASFASVWLSSNPLLLFLIVENFLGKCFCFHLSGAGPWIFTTQVLLVTVKQPFGGLLGGKVDTAFMSGSRQLALLTINVRISYSQSETSSGKLEEPHKPQPQNPKWLLCSSTEVIVLLVSYLLPPSYLHLLKSVWQTVLSSFSLLAFCYYAKYRSMSVSAVVGCDHLVILSYDIWLLR